MPVHNRASAVAAFAAEFIEGTQLLYKAVLNEPVRLVGAASSRPHIETYIKKKGSEIN